jgi:hypothetical protein
MPDDYATLHGMVVAVMLGGVIWTCLAWSVACWACR